MYAEDKRNTYEDTKMNEQEFKTVAKKHSEALAKWNLLRDTVISLESARITLKQAIINASVYEVCKTKFKILCAMEKAKEEYLTINQEMASANDWAKSQLKW